MIIKVDKSQVSAAKKRRKEQQIRAEQYAQSVSVDSKARRFYINQNKGILL